MGHFQESTLAVAQDADSFPGLLTALWEDSTFVRVEVNETITVHCDTTEQLGRAKRLCEAQKAGEELPAPPEEEVDLEQLDRSELVNFIRSNQLEFSVQGMSDD